jgi:hypothetical protein
MPPTDSNLLDKLKDTSRAAHAAFNRCPIGDPLKLRLADERDKADNAYLDAINDGLSGNSDEIQQAAEDLDAANQAVNDALDAAKTTAEVLAALQQAVGFAIQLAQLAAVV